MKNKSKPWFVYLARCRDNSLYCGVSTDIAKRIAAHNSGKGAKYINLARRPAVLVYQETYSSKSAALKREYAIKQFTKAKKEQLIAPKE